MNRRNASKSRLVLIELVIMIVFLALAGAICINLFAKAHLMSDRSSDLSQGIPLVQEAAEWTKELAPDLPAIAKKLEGTVSEGMVVVYLDASFNVTQMEDMVYHLQVLPQAGETDIWQAEIALYKGEELLHSVVVGSYLDIAERGEDQ